MTDNIEKLIACKTCRFGVSLSERYHECRFNPPIVCPGNDDYPHETLWPEVEPDKWCGKHEPKKHDVMSRAIEIKQGIMDGISGIYLDVLPCEDGSVEIHCKNELFELLVNFPTDENELAGYYIDDYRNKKYKGGFLQSEPKFIINTLKFIITELHTVEAK